MNIFYLDIDTLRPDHLSCYGYDRPTPNIDALAEDSVRFTQAYASNTPCMPSRAALFTGCFGVINGVETHGVSALSVRTPPETALARVLSEKEVHTVTISSFGRHPAPWFYNGFSHVIDPSYRSHAENFQRFPGSAVNDAALDFLDGFHGKDLFLHLHYWDPHGPLRPPAEWIDRNYTPDTSAISDEMIMQLAASPLYRGGMHTGVRTRRDLEELLRLYDAEIRYTDHLIGAFCDALRLRGLYDNSYILLSSDHGEQYGEAQMILEHGSVHDSCIHIPLLLKLPDQAQAGTICPAPVYGLDLTPTFARVFDASIPESWNGTALQDTLYGSAAPREYLICEHGLYTCQRAVFSTHWKMVHTFNSGLWDFPEYALYDRKNDPCEHTDVKAQHPDILLLLQKQEQYWLEQTLHGAPDILAELGHRNAQHGLHIAHEVTQRLRAASAHNA